MEAFHPMRHQVIGTIDQRTGMKEGDRREAQRKPHNSDGSDYKAGLPVHANDIGQISP
jgi:hypothetical protein